MTIAARTTGGRRVADELRAMLASMNPDVPVAAAQTLDDSVAFGLTPQRAAASVAGSLGLVGLLLTGIGIYGVMAYAVTRRTREIGIRIALGAQRRDVIRMVLREALSLIVIGSVIGMVVAAALSRVLAGFFFGIAPADPVTYGWTTVLFTTIGLAACCVPVLRATRIEPKQALRYE
jgi:ABC-type antimicrobial peptide transport system permease subunit